MISPALRGAETSPPTAPNAIPRPLLRGVLHLIGALLAPVGLVALILLADTPRHYVGAAIFAASLVLLYTTSASYHLAPWDRRKRAIMTRLDHSMIFVLIAGSYTPFCLVVVGDAWGIPMLAVVWSLAAAGILLKTVWIGAPRWLGVGLYLGLGWLGIVATPVLFSTMSAGALWMLALGGLMYSVGAVVYAQRWPNPWPRVFGYHEVFHALVIAGSAIHFSLVAAYVLT